jgi:hypothetical protein
MEKHISRRTLIARGVNISLGSALVPVLASCGGDGGGEKAVACADPETMSAAESSMRASLGYTADSPNPSETCADCTYFTAGEGACGACTLLGGAQVNGSGRCNSWSVRG